MLLSARIPLPGKPILFILLYMHTYVLFTMRMIYYVDKVFAHGFVNAQDGRKMSKSYNNSVDPNEVYSFACHKIRTKSGSCLIENMFA